MDTTGIKHHCPECGSVDVIKHGRFWSCESRHCGYRSTIEFPHTTKDERNAIDRREGRL